MPNHIYTTQDKVFFVREFFSGTSLRTIAEKFVLLQTSRTKPSPATIKNIVNRFNETGNVNRVGTYKQPGKALPDDKKASICEKRRSNIKLPITVIAREVGVSPASVRAVLRENGLHKPPAQAPKRAQVNSTNTKKKKQVDQNVTNGTTGCN